MYKKNIELLKEYNPFLEAELNLVSGDEIDVVKVEDELIFKLTDDKGNEFYSGSIYDPKYEAECLINTFNKDNTGYLVLGLSNSSLINKLMVSTIETAWIIIVEPDKRVVKKFLENYDLSYLVNENNKRLLFVTGSLEQVKESFLMYINSMLGYYFISPEIIKTFPTLRKYTNYFNEVIEVFKDIVVNYAYNTGNDLDDTLLGIKNEIINLHYLNNRPTLKSLKGCLEGRKVICVSSGPSLDKQLELLKQAQGKAIIISAESAFKALIAHGITPDIVCILERGENSLHFSIEGVKIPEKSYLFGLTVIEPQIYEVWGEKSVPCFKDNLTYSNELNKRLGDFGQFTSGNSVAHFNLMLADYLGAEDIILIGQDLAFSETGEHHSKSTPYSQLTEAEEKKYNLKIDNEATIYLEGYYGGKVKSKKLWKQFLMWFEILIKQIGSNVINATEGGALINGAINKPFIDIIEELQNVKNVNFGDIVNSHEHRNVDISKKDIISAYQYFIDIFEKIDIQSNKQIKDTKTLLKLLDVFEMHELIEEVKSTLSNNEMNVFRTILNNNYSSFYFSPVITEMHIRINPISRISDKRRLQEILLYQLKTIEKIERYSKKYISMVTEELKRLKI